MCAEGFGVGNEGAANQFCCAARAPSFGYCRWSFVPSAVRRIFLPIDTPCTMHTQQDLDTDMEDETGPVQSKTNKKRVLMKLKGSSSSVRRETMKYEASSGKDLARALSKLSPGGMNEFVQSVPVNIAGSLMRVCSSIYSVALVAF